MPSPEAIAMIETFTSQPAAPATPALSYPEQREMTGRMFASIDPVPADATLEDTVVAGVPARWITLPESEGTLMVLYLHGGGHVTGGITSHQGVATRIARAARARALVLDYRLAPENPFPAGLDDAINAYLELLDAGIDPRTISMAGDSSGGGLVISLLIALRDRGIPLPAAAAVMSPWGDLTLSGQTIESMATKDPLLHRENLELWASLYAGDAPRDTALVSPVHADLSGLPPILIQVGTEEMLLSDSDRLANKISEAGGSVSYERADGLFHTYQLFPHIPEAREAVDRIGTFLATHCSNDVNA